jgi:hypothetical protein
MKQAFYISRENKERTLSDKRMLAELNRYGESYKYTETLYILTSSLPYQQVYDRLKPYLDPEDRIYAG